MKKPIVITNIGGNPELIEHKHNGLLVPKQDVDRLYDAITYLLDHEGERDLFGKRARESVLERFDYDKQIRELSRLLEEEYCKFSAELS